MSGASARAVAVAVGAIDVSVRAVPDPELGGVTIGELGLVVSVEVDDANAASVVLIPTFLGCPALRMIADDVRRAAMAAGASAASVRFAHEPAWTPDRISAEGRRQLAEVGIAVPVAADAHTPAVTSCPICGSSSLEARSPVGPTACRSVAWCPACRNVVEIMRGNHAHL